MTLYSACTHICRWPCPTKWGHVIVKLSLCNYCVFCSQLAHTALPASLSSMSFCSPSSSLSPFLLPLIPLPPLLSVPLSPLYYYPFSLLLLFPVPSILSPSPSVRLKCFPHLLNSTTFSTCGISLGSGRGCCMFNMRHVPMWKMSWHCGSMSVPGSLLTGSPTTRYMEIWWTSLAFNFDLAFHE